jgi:hypothetical protein
MADGSPAGPADGLTPEQEEVRRLLADARHTGPMPDDVADRLDRVLAGLATDSDDDRVAAPAAAVVSLASRRRRRATSALVAAAAVVAVGIGLGQVIGDGVGGGGSADSSAASSSQDEGASLDRPAAKRRSHRAGDSTKVFSVADPQPIRPRHFSADVRRVQEVLVTRGADNLSAQGSPVPEAAASDVCVPTRGATGTVVPVRYGRQRGVLVFRAAQGESRVVELFACGNPAALRSVTLPAP